MLLIINVLALPAWRIDALSFLGCQEFGKELQINRINGNGKSPQRGMRSVDDRGYEPKSFHPR